MNKTLTEIDKEFEEKVIQGLNDVRRLEFNNPYFLPKNKKICEREGKKILKIIIKSYHQAITQVQEEAKKEGAREERERIKKLIENTDLYMFPIGLPRVGGIDEQGIKYEGMAINVDKLLPTNKTK